MHCSKSICFVLGLLSQTGCTILLVKTCPSTVNQITLDTTVVNGKTAAVINANWVTKQLVSFLCPTAETKTVSINIIFSLYKMPKNYLPFLSDWLYQYSSPVTTFSTQIFVRLYFVFCSLPAIEKANSTSIFRLLFVLMNDLPFND